MGVNLNAHYVIEERLIHAFGRRAKRANLKRSDSRLLPKRNFPLLIAG